MTLPSLPAAIRRPEMLRLIEERGFMRVSDLSRIFRISEVTVRSDLDAIAASSSVERVHGGAMNRDGQPHVEHTFEESRSSFADEKAAIGAAAAALVMPGDSLIIDVGTVTTAVAGALAARKDLNDIFVFTNGLTIAMELEPEIPRFTVMVTGGRLRPQQHSLVEPMAELILDQINATTAFIGCNGIHPEAGLTNINLSEAAVKARMVKAAHQVVVVAEGSKLGQISVARFAQMTDIDVIITGPSAPSELVAQIADLGIVTTIAE
ncbi:MAG: DeoR/GlpR transcriptional regulator [bacterium]|nr:DeoR/GlpR transcriptional regulator [bacterium]